MCRHERRVSQACHEVRSGRPGIEYLGNSWKEIQGISRVSTIISFRGVFYCGFTSLFGRRTRAQATDETRLKASLMKEPSISIENFYYSIRRQVRNGRSNAIKSNEICIVVLLCSLSQLAV